MSALSDFVVRLYCPADEASWLRCRLLAFFGTCYYDDVQVSRAEFELPAVQLVAIHQDELVGLIDVEIDGSAATIDCVAVHPDFQRMGLGGRLLAAVLEQLPSTVKTLDAWTREDSQALEWYSAAGFVEQFRYLHVYKGYAEPADGFNSPSPLSPPVMGFYHAAAEHEVELRTRYSRVYVCRQFLRVLDIERNSQA